MSFPSADFMQNASFHDSDMQQAKGLLDDAELLLHDRQQGSAPPHTFLLPWIPNQMFC